MSDFREWLNQKLAQLSGAGSVDIEFTEQDRVNIAALYALTKSAERREQSALEFDDSATEEAFWSWLERNKRQPSEITSFIQGARWQHAQMRERIDAYAEGQVHRSIGNIIAENDKLQSRVTELEAELSMFKGFMEAECSKLTAKNARLRKALKIFHEFDRKQGYPTGIEWMALLDRTRKALAAEGE